MKRLLSAFLLVFATSAADATSAGPENYEWRFRALLDDEPIGYHNFILRGSGDYRVLDSQADFEVKLLFINAYDYDHRATEQWAGNCLRRIQATTNDNGKAYRVAGSLRGRQFTVTTGEGPTRLPGCVMSFAYWNPEILNQDRLLNAQTGEFVDVEVSFMGREKITIGSRPVDAQRYRLEAEGRQITLWYSAQGRHWLGLEVITDDGYELRYELENPLPQQVSLNQTSSTSGHP
jgi:hypothetical protein